MRKKNGKKPHVPAAGEKRYTTPHRQKANALDEFIRALVALFMIIGGIGSFLVICFMAFLNRDYQTLAIFVPGVLLLIGIVIKYYFGKHNGSGDKDKPAPSA